MTVWLEVALQALPSHRLEDRTLGALAGELGRIAAFAGAASTQSRLATREIPLKASGWRLSVDTLDGARTLCAAQEQGAPIPGFTRYRTFARPASEDLAASLRDFAAADDALRGPLAKAHRLVAPETGDSNGLEREIERIEWRIDAGGADILATLETSAPALPILRLAALAVDGSLDAVFSLAGEVLDAGPFAVASSAPDRASAEAVHAARLELPRTATRRAAFTAIAASIAEQWFGNEAASRADFNAGLGDEHVHQLRVGQRRLKTLFKLFPAYADDAWNTRVAPGLKWFGDLLAEARDWDVFTDKTLPAYASADDSAARWQALIAAADVKRCIAREQVRDALASRRYARLALAFVEWLARFSSREDEAPTRFVSYAEKRIRRDFRRIANASDLRTLAAHERHRVRIHAKRLRYALEFFRSVASRRTREDTAALLGQLQTVLGEANDATVAAERLASMPEATDYQRGFARAWGAASAGKDAQEGERLLRSIPRPRVKASI